MYKQLNYKAINKLVLQSGLAITQHNVTIFNLFGTTYATSPYASHQSLAYSGWQVVNLPWYSKLWLWYSVATRLKKN